MNELLERLKENDPSLTKLQFFSETLITREVKRLAEAIAQNETLKELYSIRTVMSRIGWKYILDAIAHNKTLTTLRLEIGEIDDVGGECLAKFIIQNKTLTGLHLENSNIGDEGAQYLAKSIIENNTLTTLDLSNIDISALGIKYIAYAVAQNKALTTLYLKANKINNETSVYIAKIIAENKTLTMLDLGDNNIGDVGAEYIAIALGQNKTLLLLNLTGNLIMDAGAKYIGDGIAQNKTLSALSLGHNGISDLGTNYIVNGITQNRTLTALSLTGNFIGCDGAKYIADEITKNNTLNSLFLSGNEIGDTGVMYIVKAITKNKIITLLDMGGNNISHVGARYIADAIAKNKTLTSLSLSKNEIGHVGVKYITESLCQNETLTTLTLSKNGIGDKGAKYLSDGIPKNNTLITLILGDNQISDDGAQEIVKALSTNYTLTEIDIHHSQIKKYLIRNRLLTSLKEVCLAKTIEELNIDLRKLKHSLSMEREKNYPVTSKLLATCNIINLLLINELSLVETFYWTRELNLQPQIANRLIAHALFTTESTTLYFFPDEKGGKQEEGEEGEEGDKERKSLTQKDKACLILLTLARVSLASEVPNIIMSAICCLQNRNDGLELTVQQLTGAKKIVSLTTLREKLQNIEITGSQNESIRKCITHLDSMSPQCLYDFLNCEEAKPFFQKHQETDVVTFEHLALLPDLFPIKQNKRTLGEISTGIETSSSFSKQIQDSGRLLAQLMPLEAEFIIITYDFFKKLFFLEPALPNRVINDLAMIYQKSVPDRDSQYKYVELLSCLKCFLFTFTENEKNTKYWVGFLGEAILEDKDASLLEVLQAIEKIEQDWFDNNNAPTSWQIIAQSMKLLFESPSFQTSINITELYYKPDNTLVLCLFSKNSYDFVISEVSSNQKKHPEVFFKPESKIVKQDLVLHIDQNGKYSLHRYVDVENKNYDWNNSYNNKVCQAYLKRLSVVEPQAMERCHPQGEVRRHP